MKFCHHCGNQLSEHAKFCGSCGNALVLPTQGNTENIHQPEVAYSSISKSVFQTATEKINKYTGETGSVDIQFKDLFSEVSKPHSNEEAEEIFSIGTRATTPKLEDVSDSWAKPWLFSKIFMMFAIGFAGLYYAVVDLESGYAIPGLIFFGAFAVPFSTLIFFFESNMYQNISIYETIKIFFIGGVFSIVITLLLYEMFPLSLDSYYYGVLTTSDAILIGLVEEAGKLLLLIYFVKKYNTKYILNGLLIGAAIGAGFAAFETSGYILENMMYGEFLAVTFLRGISSIGSHLAWTAIVGGALVMVKSGGDFTFSHLANQRFLFFFGSSIALHAVWDMEVPFVSNVYIKLAILITLAWLEILTLMNAGLREITTIKTTKLNV